MANSAGFFLMKSRAPISTHFPYTTLFRSGLVTVNAGAGAITLSNANDFRGALNLTNSGANNISVTDANTLLLATVSMANLPGTLTVNSTVAITQNVATTITTGTGNVSFNS